LFFINNIIIYLGVLLPYTMGYVVLEDVDVVLEDVDGVLDGVLAVVHPSPIF
jgi:hypothetical protein